MELSEKQEHQLRWLRGSISVETDKTICLQTNYGQELVAYSGSNLDSLLAEALSDFAEWDDTPFPLTQRELEICKHIADGLSSKEAAAAVGISYQTLRHHISSIYRKLGVSKRIELVTLLTV